jgi:hypothetical protein
MPSAAVDMNQLNQEIIQWQYETKYSDVYYLDSAKKR